MNLKKLERYLRVNLLEPGPHLIKKNLTGRGLTEVEKHWIKQLIDLYLNILHCTRREHTLNWFL